MYYCKDCELVFEEFKIIDLISAGSIEQIAACPGCESKHLAECMRCEACNGTGKKICTNPYYGSVSALSFIDKCKIGCPCCGYDKEQAIPNTTCEVCNGTGIVM